MNRVNISEDNVCLARINETCINCGTCLKTCNETNNFEGKDCINCGQCILTCPTASLVPKYNYQKVINYIKDTDYITVAFTAPSVRVSIGDEFGLEAGTFLEKKLVSALKSIGFDYVFDTTFGADLTIMEEANELFEKIKNHKLPMFTSCCPAWVLFMNKNHPEDLKYLSSCKSPIAMQAEMIKTYFANMYDIPKEKIIAVSINPCIAKKYERILYPETDISITTRELAILIKQSGIDFNNLKDEEFDRLMGKGSSSGLLFGVSGGVSEAVLRTVYYMLNKKEAPSSFYNIESIRNEADFKEAIIDFEITKLKVAVVNKISTVKKYYDELKKYDFIEVMECPGGCIGGGGQSLIPISKQKEVRESRIKKIYEEDKIAKNKNSYLNKEIQEAYSFYISKNNIKLHTKH